MYISDVAKRSGLSIHTLRYYEKEGLLGDIFRNASGRRVYSNTDLEWLTWIQRLKSTGMSLADIKQFATFRAQGDSSLSYRRALLSTHAEKLKTNIAQLQAELRIVEYKIDAYQEKEKTLLT